MNQLAVFDLRDAGMAFPQLCLSGGYTISVHIYNLHGRHHLCTYIQSSHRMCVYKMPLAHGWHARHVYTADHTYILSYMHAYTAGHTDSLSHTYIHTYIHTYTHTQSYSYKRTLIHAYIHSWPYSHTYVHTQLDTSESSSPKLKVMFRLWCTIDHPPCTIRRPVS